MKKLIKRLEAARGNGTSMISLIIRMLFFTPPPPFKPLELFFIRTYSIIILTRTLYVAPKDQVSRAAKMLAEEYVCLLPKHTHVAVAVLP